MQLLRFSKCVLTMLLWCFEWLPGSCYAFAEVFSVVVITLHCCKGVRGGCQGVAMCLVSIRNCKLGSLIFSV